MNALLRRLISKFSGVQTTVNADAQPPKPSSVALVAQVTDQIWGVPFETAQDVVMHFAKLVEDCTLQRCALFLDGKPVMDSNFYSKSNLTCSRSQMLTAFKAYYVLVKDKDAACAAKQILHTRVAYVVPDDWTEPLLFDDFDALLLRKKELEEILNAEQPVLDVIRETMHSGPWISGGR